MENRCERITMPSSEAGGSSGKEDDAGVGKPSSAGSTTTELRPIPGFERYYAGNDGRIYRVKCLSVYRKPPPNYGWTRYYKTSVWVNKTHTGFPLHRLVAMAFHGPPPFLGAIVRHLNDDPGDNRPENLAWGDHKDNAGDRKRNGHQVRGERQHLARLTEKEVLEVRELRVSGLSYVNIAKRFGITSMAVRHVCIGKTWKHITGGVPLPKFYAGKHSEDKQRARR